MTEEMNLTDQRHRVFLSLGSNLGDRKSNLERATGALSPEVDVITSSSIYETEPWGFLDQPYFLNQVLEAETSLSPTDLLDYLKEIEKDIGRKPGRRFGPRLVDIDILFYGDQVISEPQLTIPHKRIKERAFVLIPLAEIASQLQFPGTELVVQDLIQGIDSTGVELFQEDHG